MLTIRKSTERGHFDHGWLNTYHTFSFGDYYDPRHENFRTLRVINEDRVKPGVGFPTHAHRDMEILSYVLEGTLQHKDSLGNGTQIRPGELQRMSAGTGVRHSEWNASQQEPVHFLQIWILPREHGLPPGYEQRLIEPPAANGLRLMASPQGREGSVTLHQDVDLYLGKLTQNGELNLSFKPDRFGWLQMLRGGGETGGISLEAGDGLAIDNERELRLRTDDHAEFLLFDLN